MDDPVKRLQRLDVCAVSDAMDKLGLPPSVSGLTQQSTQQRIAGKVVTYKLVPAAQVPAHAGAPRHLGTTAIEAAEPGDVIVIEQRTGLDAGSWGGILSLAAKLRQVAGVVVDGPVRDIDEARAYEFPVYARGLTARTARARVAEAFTNQPVRIGEVTVCPGDYVIADASGAVFIAAADIERVLQAAEMIVGREAAMAQALRAGKPVSQVMGADYEHMLK
jgi:4-hydroxy-4-methyl-2-oxoglutarate aldolase